MRAYHLLLLVVFSVWRHNIIRGLGVARVVISGPATAWVRPLSEVDRDRMRVVCPSNNDYSQYQSSLSSTTTFREVTTTNPNRYLPPSPRIIDGEPSRLGVFPYAATFTNDPTNERSRWAYCGATLISPRHLITAVHCSKLYHNATAFMLLDGVCVRRTGEDGCVESAADTMRAVEIDLILEEYYAYRATWREPLDHL